MCAIKYISAKNQYIKIKFSVYYLIVFCYKNRGFIQNLYSNSKLLIIVNVNIFYNPNPPPLASLSARSLRLRLFTFPLLKLYFTPTKIC